MAPTPTKPVEIPLGPSAVLSGDLSMPPAARAVIVFAHGSGSSRHSPRNRQVAARLQDEGLGTLLLDLLTEQEETVDIRTRQHRFDIELLAERLAGAVAWLDRQSGLEGLGVGYFGASTGAAAALVAAAGTGDRVGAVVSRGGRPDLAGAALAAVRAPTLLIVGSRDETVLELNRQAYEQLRCERRLEVVAGASHPFQEPGTLEQAADLAAARIGRRSQ